MYVAGFAAYAHKVHDKPLEWKLLLPHPLFWTETAALVQDGVTFTAARLREYRGGGQDEAGGGNQGEAGGAGQGDAGSSGSGGGQAASAANEPLLAPLVEGKVAAATDENLLDDGSPVQGNDND